MKKNKILSLILMITLFLSMGMVAFAEVHNPPPHRDESTVTINKALTALPEASNPADTFTFNVGEGTYAISEGATETTIAPAFGNDSTFTIDVAKGGTTGTTNINLTNFDNVGVYTYPITEVAGNTAGMTYDGATYYLAITVINNLDPVGGFKRVLTIYEGNDVKTDTFNNTFNAGSLTINKEIAGNYADPDDKFVVTVTLSAVVDKVLKNEMITSVGADSTTVVDGGTGTVTVKYTVQKGTEFTINNIPYDVEYTVVEAVDKGYTVSYDGATGTINAENAAPVTTITNTRNKGIETGISLDNLPYMILVAATAAGFVTIIVKRKRRMEF